MSLQAFRPDFADTTPNLQTLQIAIQTVAVQAPRVGMKRAVFLITPHMEEPDIEALVAPLIELARQNNVRVLCMVHGHGAVCGLTQRDHLPEPGGANRRRVLRGD